MRNILFLLLILPFLQCTYSTRHYLDYAVSGSLVINDEIGDIIDSKERENYDLFRGIEGFVSAELYALPNAGYEIRMVTAKGKLKAVMADPLGIEILKDYISRYEEIKRNRAPFEKRWKIVTYDDLGQSITQGEMEQVGTPGEVYCGVGGCCLGLGVAGYVGIGIYQPEGDAYNVVTTCCILPSGLAGVWAGTEIGKRFDKIKAIKAIREARKPHEIE